MAYSPRVMTYDTGVITTASTGSASYFTAHAIVGRIIKIAAKTAVAGSMTITESGTNESLFVKAIVSGTEYSVYYPKTLCNDNAGTALGNGSGNIWQEAAVSNYLRVQHDAGSATVGKSFTNVRLYYM